MRTKKNAVIEPIHPGLRREFQAVHVLIGTLIEGKSAVESEEIPREIIYWIKRRTKKRSFASRKLNRFCAATVADEWTPKNIPETRLALDALKMLLNEDDTIVWAPYPTESHEISGKLMVAPIAHRVSTQTSNPPSGDEGEEPPADRVAPASTEKIRVALVVSELYARLVKLAQEIKEANPETYGDAHIVQMSPANVAVGWSIRKTRGAGVSFTIGGKALLEEAIEQMSDHYPAVFHEAEEEVMTAQQPSMADLFDDDDEDD